MKTKFALVAATLLFAATMSADALETSVKPAVTDLGITPQSYMLVGNSFTFYSCGMHNMINRLARERQKFCVHGIIGARQTGASNEHEHQTQFS